MLYTVKDVSELSGVTIKTLHHYHKIGLLMPCETSEAGYRLYGMKELERLQHILFYRELDFPLEKIKRLLEGPAERPELLAEQKNEMVARKHRLERLIQTMDEALKCAAKGESMDTSNMFKGFESEEAWKAALEEQNRHLKQTYDYDMLEEKTIDVDEMNEKAMEAMQFMKGMADRLVNGVRYDHEDVRLLIRKHLDYMNGSGTVTAASDFAAQTRFFVSDEFHRHMLESQQTGLAYYLCFAAEAFAAE
ncbi:MerR family transcriptional regulator [Paenibacillus allorhizosphaerae]|uniref:HTH merR-type domain-containing protein n=1 Tax=Paenibacillus allorhizosphaerae TaxID=2849866 RepID=A0ABM8VT05_9BACL|nr:MerR family transcriptional regulator [Paenibacillus allorhizosphaerae]CAG7657228.1 hypothetical protein PAECIP111802_06662 [Paenibacillus allorhizosphaerae]